MQSLPSSYLGLPLGVKSSIKSIRNPVLEKMKKRLTNWKGNYLSKGGKLVLLKSVLSCMAIYVPSLFVAPRSIQNRLEKLQRDFLWQNDRDKRKINWVSWVSICNPIEKWGLGIRSVRSLNRALLTKWLWRFGFDRDSLWQELIASKYEEEQNGWVSCRSMGTIGRGV